jgi:hypothetical protein
MKQNTFNALLPPWVFLPNLEGSGPLSLGILREALLSGLLTPMLLPGAEIGAGIAR